MEFFAPARPGVAFDGRVVVRAGDRDVRREGELGAPQ